MAHNNQTSNAQTTLAAFSHTAMTDGGVQHYASDESSDTGGTSPTTDTWSFDESDDRSDEMNETVTEWIDELVADIREAKGSERFQEWLDAQSAFHSYSVNNALLIRRQCPHATRVAGFHTWRNEFDRHVQEGESAIWIWRPIITERCPECENSESYHTQIGCEYDDTPPEEWDEGVVSFAPAPVFDVSQTEGEALPDLPTAATGDGSVLRTALLDASESLSVTVDIVPTADWTNGAADGICNFETVRSSVKVCERASDAAVAGTLIHEYTHAILHDSGSNDKRKQQEVEAEATAYIVGRHFGLNMEGSSFYLADWAGDDPDVIRERLDQINSAAQRLIDAIE
jgi:hypothetical protein